jgi:thiol-disulfide isomerase/thioredoxin
MEELIKKPVDLKFTAVDGSEVDLTKLRGKVVLLDFWATWCPPCVEEVPNVVAAYKKYHDQGFEVVGVSLDQDKDQLLNFTKAHGMVWPQAFDGKSFDGDIPSSFSIQSIPQMILINKQGQILPESGREDLDGKVAKLLTQSDAGPSK